MTMSHQLDLVDIRRPEEPKPLTFAFNGEIDSHTLRWARTAEERRHLFAGLKRRASHELADFIFKNCKLFEPPGIGPEITLRMELSINDRGAYVNWLPEAEQRGKSQGREQGRKQAIKEMVESLPYGMADAAQEFYE